MRGVLCGPCETGMQHGWAVLPTLMSGRRTCHVLFSTWDPYGPGLLHGSGCDQEGEENSTHSTHDSYTRPCTLRTSRQESK